MDTPAAVADANLTAWLQFLTVVFAGIMTALMAWIKEGQRRADHKADEREERASAEREEVRRELKVTNSAAAIGTKTIVTYLNHEKGEALREIWEAREETAKATGTPEARIRADEAKHAYLAHMAAQAAVDALAAKPPASDEKPNA